MTRAIAATMLLWLAAQIGAAETVHVRLFSVHPPSKVQITPQGALQARTCATCQPWKVTTPLQIAASGGQLRILGSPSSRSVPLQSLIFGPGRYQIDVPNSPPLHLDAPLAVRAADGALQLTVTLPLEEYVAAVLAGESGGFRSDEALKAMAVAARTFAVRFRGRHHAEGFDFCDTTHCQDLRWSAMSSRLQNAAAATEGEMLWYGGRPAAAYYHRSCGGTIEAGRFLDAEINAPYLRQRADPYCVLATRDDWRSEILKSELRAALEASRIRVPPAFSLSVHSRTPTGRVQSVGLGNTAQAPLGAERFRVAVGRSLGWDRIRSDLYAMSDRGSSIVFLGRGQGHGVGLCQTGAEQMGEQGKHYRDILSFYYPGTAIGLTASGLAWQQRIGERVELLSTDVKRDEELIGIAQRMLRDAERTTRWKLPQRAQIKVFPTVAVFRDGTGEPGWVAASTRGHVIRTQPLEALARSGSVENIVRHEMFHMLVEEHAHRDLPLWFREGVVLALSETMPPKAAGQFSAEWVEQTLRNPADRAQAQRAYAASELRVRGLIAEHGIPTVLGWVEHGLPDAVLRQVGLGAAMPSRR